jgi:hypothetical protein
MIVILIVAVSVAPLRAEGPAFAATRVVNLPTTNAIGRGDILFRVSHRFLPAVSGGYEHFYGLNGPAYILVSLGYGVTDDLDITLGHSNLFHEFEFTVKQRMLGGGTGAPALSASVVAGADLVTLDPNDEGVFRSENVKFHAALPIAWRATEKVSLLAVPMYATNTNHWEDPSDNTLALGLGGQMHVLSGLSVVAEWTTALDGYDADGDGWGVGLEYEVGGHVFQLIGTNVVGLTVDQFAPGSTSELGTGDMRLGFSIFRMFWR